MTTPTRINVIIPTLGSADRACNLLDSLDRFDGQNDLDVVPIVVVNGNAFDRELYAQLQNRPGIRLIRTKLNGLPNAYLVGRKAVDGEFFCFLDDDDEYTDDALTKRVRPFLDNDDIDVVVSNGYRKSQHGRNLTSFYQTFPTNDSDPLAALVQNNWLTSCGALFRTASIGDDYFIDLATYYEWTSLASRLATRAKLYFINEKTFVVNDTPGSLSKSSEYILEEPLFLKKLIRNTPFQARERRILGNRLASSYNRLANYYLNLHDYKTALHYHGKCILSSRHGLKYSFWPRYLLRHWLVSKTAVDFR